ARRRRAMSAGSRPSLLRITPASQTIGPRGADSRTAYPVTCRPGSMPRMRGPGTLPLVIIMSAPGRNVLTGACAPGSGFRGRRLDRDIATGFFYLPHGVEPLVYSFLNFLFVHSWVLLSDHSGHVLAKLLK